MGSLTAQELPFEYLLQQYSVGCVKSPTTSKQLCLPSPSPQLKLGISLSGSKEKTLNLILVLSFSMDCCEEKYKTDAVSKHFENFRVQLSLIIAIF